MKKLQLEMMHSNTVHKCVLIVFVFYQSLLNVFHVSVSFMHQTESIVSFI